MATKKMCDMSCLIAAKVFEMLNYGKVKLENERSPFRVRIITDVEPKGPIYPEGWYYGKGCFRNKHLSTTGIYEEVTMVKSNGNLWRESAHYCTIYDD